MREWIIKLLGGFTQKEIDNTPNQKERRAVQLEREIYREEHEKYIIAEYDKIALEEALFLVTDLLHNATEKKISLKQIEEIMVQARLLTRYANQEHSGFKKHHEDFLNYLKNDIWKQIYGKTYNEFKHRESYKGKQMGSKDG